MTEYEEHILWCKTCALKRHDKEVLLSEDIEYFRQEMSESELTRNHEGLSESDPTTGVSPPGISGMVFYEV